MPPERGSQLSAEFVRQLREGNNFYRSGQAFPRPRVERRPIVSPVVQNVRVTSGTQDSDGFQDAVLQMWDVDAGDLADVAGSAVLARDVTGLVLPTGQYQGRLTTVTTAGAPVFLVNRAHSGFSGCKLSINTTYVWPSPWLGGAGGLSVADHFTALYDTDGYVQAGESTIVVPAQGYYRVTFRASCRWSVPPSDQPMNLGLVAMILPPSEEPAVAMLGYDASDFVNDDATDLRGWSPTVCAVWEGHITDQGPPGFAFAVDFLYNAGPSSLEFGYQEEVDFDDAIFPLVVLSRTNRAQTTITVHRLDTPGDTIDDLNDGELA